MVNDRKYMVHTIHGTQYMVHITWEMVHSTWHMIHSTWYIVRGTLRVVHSTWEIVHGTYYINTAHGTKNVEQSTWQGMHDKICGTHYVVLVNAAHRTKCTVGFNRKLSKHTPLWVVDRPSWPANLHAAHLLEQTHSHLHVSLHLRAWNRKGDARASTPKHPAQPAYPSHHILHAHPPVSRWQQDSLFRVSITVDDGAGGAGWD